MYSSNKNKSGDAGRTVDDARKNVKNLQRDYQTAGGGSKKKPTFPAYVPSHLDTGIGYKEDKYKRDMYDYTQLYVTNLPTNTNMAEVSKMFPACIGIALGVNDQGESNAAYVEFESSSEAETACVKARGATIRGNTVIVSPKLKFN